MRREERFMNILGGLDEKYVAMAMPSSCGHSIVGDSGNVIEIKSVEDNIEISKKDLRIYWISRALGMAAALALVVGGGVWLWQNWDKIAVSGNNRPGEVTTVTTVSAPVITNDTTSTDTTEPDIADRFEQVTDTSMPECGLDLSTEEYRNFSFPWRYEFVEIRGELIKYADPEKHIEWGEKGSKWDQGTPYRLNESHNVYSYIGSMGISWEAAAQALEETGFSEEEINAMKSDDIEKIIKLEASEYSVVVGENVFSPKWLYYHTIDDYKAAGIPTTELYNKMTSYKDIGLTNEAWKAFCKKVYSYVTRQDIPAEELYKLTVYDNDVPEPLGDRAFEILEDVFYGEWKTAQDNGYPTRKLPLTYGKSHVINLIGVFEYDDMYIMEYADSAGIGCCCIVRKDEPDVMYSAEIGFVFGSTVITSSFDDMIKYTERKYETPKLRVGSEISFLGEKLLVHKYGNEFKEIYKNILDGYEVPFDFTPFQDERGSLYLANSYTSSDISRYLIAMSDNAVTLDVPYVRDSQELAQTPEYFEVTLAENGSGEWSVSYSPTDIAALISKMNDDLIPVVGDNGKEGYIHSKELFAAPSSAEEAIAQREEMKNGTYKLKTVYVYESDGKTIIDTFTESPEPDPGKVILNDDGTYTVIN